MTFELRRITAADVEPMTALAIQGMRAYRYPLALAPENIRRVGRHFLVDAPDRFQLAAFNEGTPVAGLAVTVQPMLWFQGSEAVILMGFASKSGAGIPLLRAMLKWISARSDIRRVIWPHEAHGDPRIQVLARRLGFQQLAISSVLYKE